MSYGTFKSYYDKNEQTTRKTNRLREKRTDYEKNEHTTTKTEKHAKTDAKQTLKQTPTVDPILL